MNKMLCEILSICHKISINSDADIFFEYMPHCDAYCVRICPQGWAMSKIKNTPMITSPVESITIENMKNTIIKLKAIALFLEVEL